MIQIYAFRHGPVKANGLCYGQIDVAMSMSAQECLAQVQGALNHQLPVDVVWTSPLERCRMLAHEFGSPYQIDVRLMEASFGRWEGLSWTDIYQSYPQQMDAWGSNWYNVAPPGGESARMLEERVKIWADSLTPGTHLVFTHAGVIRSLRVLCQGNAWEKVIEEAVPHLTLESFHYKSSES